MPERIWKKVTLRVPREVAEPLADFLATLTGRGVCYREEGGEVAVDTWLDPESAEDQILRIRSWVDDVTGAGQVPPGRVPVVAEVPEEDWMSVFRSQHGVVRISDRLVVRPTWCEPTGSEEVVLDPGLAFGTGGHQTTRMCLVLLDEVLSQRVPGRMFDLGTGSGILAIAGAFLGVKHVLAADVDPVAVETAAANAEANGVGDRVRLVNDGVQAAEGTYGIVTANLSGGLLRRLCDRIAGALEAAGVLIVSGFIPEEKDGVLEAFHGCGLSTEKVIEEDGWCAALLGRRE